MGALPDSVNDTMKVGALIIATIAIAGTLGITAMLGWGMGQLSGIEEERHRMETQENCLKWEKRQFADVGFLIFAGSGEVIWRNVCVHWEYRR